MHMYAVIYNYVFSMSVCTLINVGLIVAN